jgi:hypothetical protein
MKRILVLLALLGFTVAFAGCKASSKADEDGVAVEIEKS